MIERVNQLSLNPNARKPEEVNLDILHHTRMALISDYWLKEARTIGKKWMEKHFSPIAVEYSYGDDESAPSDDSDKIKDAGQILNEDYLLRAQFYYLAELVEEYILNLMNSKEEINQLKEGSLLSAQVLTNFNKQINGLPKTPKYKIDENGFMDVTLDEFSQAINGVDITRIRKCKKCQQIFWAKRDESKCCSPECLSAYHAQRSFNKRRADPKSHAWEQYVKEEANKRAKKELAKIGYRKSHIKEYQRKNRKFPHRVIYDYLIQECLKPRTRKSPAQIKINKAIIQSLSRSLSEM